MPVRFGALSDFFPLLVHDKIKSHCDDVWQMVLLLRLIVEILCAPQITYVNISCLSEYIDEYMGLRSTIFSHIRLRPKHHYMMHFPWLLLQFGPLIHMWTLRFESKHSYFKDIVHSNDNFVNVSYTLAKTHQMLQGYLQKTE